VVELSEHHVCSAGSYDGTLFVWELDNGAVVATLKDKTQVRCLCPETLPREVGQRSRADAR
jgi:hypothetical protein